MNHWSFGKIFGKISYRDFLKMADSFYNVLYLQYPEEDLWVTVIFYKEIPHSVSAPEDGILEWVERENKGKELARITKTKGLPYFPQELFDSAVNVYLFVETKGGSIACIEAKGLLPRHIVFSVWTEKGTQVQSLCTGKYRPSPLLFYRGNGEEHLHACSLS